MASCPLYVKISPTLTQISTLSNGLIPPTQLSKVVLIKISTLPMSSILKVKMAAFDVDPPYLQRVTHVYFKRLWQKWTVPYIPVSGVNPQRTPFLQHVMSGGEYEMSQESISGLQFYVVCKIMVLLYKTHSSL